MNDSSPKTHTKEEANKLGKNLASSKENKILSPQKDQDEELILSPPEELEKSLEDIEDQDCVILREGENHPKSAGNISDESFDISEKALDAQEDPQINEQDPQEILSFSDKESMEMSIIKEEGELNANKPDKILELSSKMPPLLQGKILEFLLPDDRNDKVEQASQTDSERVIRDCIEQSVQTLNLTFEKVGKDQVMQTDMNTLQNQDKASQSDESIIQDEKATAKLCGDIGPEDRKPSEEKDRIENLVIKAVQSNLPEFASLVKSYIDQSSYDQEKPEIQNRKSSVHTLCYCDGCGMRPLVGPRYRCSVCDDFDFCERCEATKEHPHLFIKIKTPEDFTKLEQTNRKLSLGSQARSELKLKSIGTKIKESTLAKVFSGVFEHLFSGNPKPIIVESQNSPREREEDD